MSLHQTKFSPVLRGLAAGSLFVWLGALALCHTECCSDAKHGHPTEAEASHQHAEAAPHSHGDHDHGPVPQHQDEPLFCLSLKSLLHSEAGFSLSKLALQLLYALPAEPPTLQASANEALAPFIRQTWRRDRAFTPEVCLGPALRCHAPPVIS